MTSRKATAAEVRAHYKARGYQVRITREGHVTFRNVGEAWLEGRWVEEYRVVDGSVVLI